MGRNLDSQCRQCRQVGEKLFLKGERCFGPKCAIIKRNYTPGTDGSRPRRRLSDYGTQLAEKQKAKRYYGLSEKQFRLTFLKATKKQGDAGKNFLGLLESRLDNVIFRLGFATSRAQARQLVNHGHFMVDDHKVDIPSFIVKAGQVIKVRKKSEKSPYFRNITEALTRTERPGWLNLDPKTQVAKVLHLPKDEDLPPGINMQMIIEFYSK